MSIHLDEEAPPFDPESRRLCGDPACIGVIGDDGHCLECGRVGEGEEPRRHLVEADAPVDSVSTDATAIHGTADEDDDDDKVDREAIGGGDGIDDRRLCSDPGCIGVLSAEGRCSECGRPANIA